MSKREREFGEVSFSKTGYNEFVRQIRTDYNNYINKLKIAALSAYEVLSKYPKKQQREMFEKMVGYRPDRLTLPSGDFRSRPDDIQLIESELFRGVNNRLTKPRMSAFKTLTNKQKEFTIDICEADFIFSIKPDGTGLCKWDTQYGSNNVRDIEDSVLYTTIFQALSKRKWRRNEGGVWYYHDENDEESMGCDFFGDSISKHFGPIGEDVLKRRDKAIKAYIKG